jgi:hypothetical protein
MVLSLGANNLSWVIFILPPGMPHSSRFSGV